MKKPSQNLAPAQHTQLLWIFLFIIFSGWLLMSIGPTVQAASAAEVL
jgi:hypothetical protein